MLRKVAAALFSQVPRSVRLHHCSGAGKQLDFYKKTNIVGAAITGKNKTLDVQFTENVLLKYPIVWLRDNCSCPQCYEPNSKGRIITLEDFKTEFEVVKINVSDNQLYVTWNDGHESVFTRDWLTERSFERCHRLDRIAERDPRKIPWDAKQFEELPVCKNYNFDDVMTKDSALLDWLENLALYGVSILKESPKDSDTVVKLAKRIAYQRRTLYGNVFHVKNVKKAYNLAYRAGPLQFHTDLPHYRHMPGVNLLHCKVQSSGGGDNTLCDSINAVRQLPPYIHRILSSTPVDWYNKGKEDIEFISTNRSPVICEDVDGNLIRVNFNQGIRDSSFNVSLDDAIDWYEAMKVFIDVIHDPKNSVTLKIVPGDILTFDNTRMIHGRKDYTDGERHIIGAYVDWDEIYSRIRVLKTQLRQVHI